MGAGARVFDERWHRRPAPRRSAGGLYAASWRPRPGCRPSRRPSRQPGGQLVPGSGQAAGQVRWPSWRPSTSCSSRGMTNPRFPASRPPYGPLVGLAPDRRAWEGPWSGLNAQKCPRCTFQGRSVEVSVQGSVEVPVEGAGARWERTSANREWNPVPGRDFFRSGARIGNLTGKVTGNPEAHDRGGASGTADSTASSWRQRS